MSEVRFRVGLVGAGHICPFHLRALRSMPDVDVIGVHDCDPQRAEQFVRQVSAGRAFASYDELLAAVNVVHVLTPPHTHTELTVRALEAGCDVFVEKPLAATEAECRRIQQRADSLGRTVGVDHSLLMDPFTVRARRRIEQGSIGEVLSVDLLRSQDYPEYSGGEYPLHATTGGYAFRDLGIHALYQVEALLGPIRQLQWQLHVRDDLLLPINQWRVTMQCQQGTAHLHLALTSRPLQDMIIVQGTDGVLTLDRFGMNLTIKRHGRLPEHAQRAINSFRQCGQQAVQVPLNLFRAATGRLKRYHGLQAMVRDFYDALRAGRVPEAGPDEASRVAHWLEQVAADGDRRVAELRRRDSQELTAETLVTGATGFLGGHLLRRLLADGRRVRVLSRRPLPENLANDPRIEWVLGDLGHPASVERAVAGVDVVYHVGATVHGTPTEFWRGSVVGTQNIIESCLRQEVKQLIYVSSLSVLQAVGQPEKVTDESAPLECRPAERGLYTQTKLAAEKLVMAAVEQRSLPAVIVRPAEVIGHGAPRLSSGIGQRLGNRLIIFGDGQLHVPLIHVDDLLDALQLCEAQQVRDGSIFHLVDPQLVTQNQLAAEYCRLSGERLRVHHLPRPLVYALGAAAQSACWLLRRPAPVTLYRLRSALTPRRFCSTAAEQRLGWHARRGVHHAELEALGGPSDTKVAMRAVEVERVS